MSAAIGKSQSYFTSNPLTARSKQAVMNGSEAIATEDNARVSRGMKMQSSRVKEAVEARKRQALEAAYNLEAVTKDEKKEVKSLSQATDMEDYYIDDEEDEEDDEEEEDDDDLDEPEPYILLSPSECSEKYDEMLNSSKFDDGKYRSSRLDDYETQALCFAIKKEHKWNEKRKLVNEQRAKKKSRRVTDASFAKMLKLKGGAKEYESEMKRLSYARGMLVSGTIGLIRWTTNRFRHLSLSIPMEDLTRVGADMMIKAALKHDPRLGFRLSTLAVIMMKHAMIGEIGDSGRTLRIPRSVQSEYLQMLKQREAARGEGLDEEESSARMLQAMDTTPQRLARVARTMEENNVITMNAPMKTGKSKTEDGTERGDAVASPESLDHKEALKREMTQAEVVRVLDALLTPKEAAILKKRYGFECPIGTEYSLPEVAKEMNMTPEQTRQLERIGLVKLLPI